MADSLQIEVAFALPEKQFLTVVTLPSGATVADAVAASGLAAEFPHIDMDSLPAGVWGHPADRNVTLKDGDRVELYRPLLRDPREARRELAQAGLTMRGGNDTDQD